MLRRLVVAAACLLPSGMAVAGNYSTVEGYYVATQHHRHRVVFRHRSRHHQFLDYHKPVMDRLPVVAAREHSSVALKAPPPRSAGAPDYRSAAEQVQSGAVVASTTTVETYADGLAWPPPLPAKRPNRMTGKLRVGSLEFDFVTGGGVWPSIPFGDYPITPNEVGSWGSRHNAIGVNHNTLYDQQLHMTRDGIEIHRAYGSYTNGCVGVSEKQWSGFTSALHKMIADFGQAFLHIGLNAAAITPERTMALLPNASSQELAMAERRSYARRHVAYHRQHRHYAMRRRHYG